jgi:RNA polymerase sigma factor for flagellar operon FliA
MSLGVVVLPRSGEEVAERSPPGGDHSERPFPDDRCMTCTPTATPSADWERLVERTLPVVRFIVNDIVARLPRHVDRDDLMSAGMLGLTEAARSFDDGRGVTFDAFARTRIRGAVLDELRRRDPLSRRARHRGNAVSRATASMQAQLGRVPTDDEVAAELGMEHDAVRQARGDLARATSMERSVCVSTLADVTSSELADDSNPLAQVLEGELRGYLVDAVAVLPERLRYVVIAHFFDERELRDIAAELGVSASRVSQMRAEAITLLRDGINAQLEPEKVADLGEDTLTARRRAGYFRLVAAANVAERAMPERSIRDLARPAAA